jgi:hypothetical protein
MVFTGVVTSVSGFPLGLACSPDSAAPATFDVETVYKGDVPRTITVHPIGVATNCGSYAFKVGKRYTVFPSAGESGRVYALACGGEVEGAIVPADYGLPAGQPPRS